MERAVEHQEVLVERLANLVSREESDKPDALKRMDNASDARDYVKKGPLGALKSTSLPGVLPSTCTEGAGNLAAVNYRQRTETRNAPGSSHITLVGDEAAQRPAPSSLFDTMPQNIVVPDSVVESVIANLQFVRMTRGLNWIINRPILSCSIVVLVWATLRGIWSLLPGEVQEFRPALLLSGIVALAATLLAYYVGGATLMPETESEPILDEAEGPSTPVMGESADPTLTLPTDPDPDVVGTVQGDDKQDKEQQNLDVSPIVEATMEALDPGMEVVGAVHQEGPPSGGLDGRYQESMEQPTKGQNQKKEEGYSTDSDRPGPVLEGVHPINK